MINIKVEVKSNEDEPPNWYEVLKVLKEAIVSIENLDSSYDLKLRSGNGFVTGSAIWLNVCKSEDENG